MMSLGHGIMAGIITLSWDLQKNYKIHIVNNLEKMGINSSISFHTVLTFFTFLKMMI
jgi:hypothetical protein